MNGWNVNFFDPAPDAPRRISEVLANARYALPMLYDVSLPPEGTLTFCDNVSDAVKNADWIQESVPERLDLKHKVIKTLQEHCNPSAIIASSTSGFKPSELQIGATHPEQILVAHPFNPVYLLPVVELVPSPNTSEITFNKAREILTEIGMHPLHVRKEIDAHIADRFLEAVWREALWLIKDGIATTQEIDDVIRYGFGLRWAQMGLFETYRIAGGEAGMHHFIEQFGPCLKWPWTKLMDVPELTEKLTNTIADQSNAQSGHLNIRELERLRDNNLVAILRALKGQDTAAGALLNKHEANISSAARTTEASIKTIERTIPADWTDYNAHMNESRYGQVFSDAADEVMRLIGADAEYLASGFSYFTVDIHIKFLQETKAGQKIRVISKIIEGHGKKLRLYHEMLGAEDTVLATAEQLLLHVSLETRRTCDPGDAVALKLDKLVKMHALNASKAT